MNLLKSFGVEMKECAVEEVMIANEESVGTKEDSEGNAKELHPAVGEVKEEVSAVNESIVEKGEKESEVVNEEGMIDEQEEKSDDEERVTDIAEKEERNEIRKEEEIKKEEEMNQEEERTIPIDSVKNSDEEQSVDEKKEGPSEEMDEAATYVEEERPLCDEDTPKEEDDVNGMVERGGEASANDEAEKDQESSTVEVKEGMEEQQVMQSETEEKKDGVENPQQTIEENQTAVSLQPTTNITPKPSTVNHKHEKDHHSRRESSKSARVEEVKQEDPVEKDLEYLQTKGFMGRLLESQPPVASSSGSTLEVIKELTAEAFGYYFPFQFSCCLQRDTCSIHFNRSGECEDYGDPVKKGVSVTVAYKNDTYTIVVPSKASEKELIHCIIEVTLIGWVDVQAFARRGICLLQDNLLISKRGIVLSLQREQQFTVKEGTRFSIEQCRRIKRYKGERHIVTHDSSSLKRTLDEPKYHFCTALFVMIPQMMEEQFITTLLKFCFPYVTELTLYRFPFLC